MGSQDLRARVSADMARRVERHAAAVGYRRARCFTAARLSSYEVVQPDRGHLLRRARRDLLGRLVRPPRPPAQLHGPDPARLGLSGRTLADHLHRHRVGERLAALLHSRGGGSDRARFRPTRPGLRGGGVRHREVEARMDRQDGAERGTPLLPGSLARLPPWRRGATARCSTSSTNACGNRATRTWRRSLSLISSRSGRSRGSGSAGWPTYVPCWRTIPNSRSRRCDGLWARRTAGSPRPASRRCASAEPVTTTRSKRTSPIRTATSGARSTSWSFATARCPA